MRTPANHSLLLLVVGVACACRSAAPCLELRPRSAEIVREILETKRAALGVPDPNALQYHVGELVGKLHSDPSPDADMAAVVLMEYSIGEASGEDVWDDILLRGKRMIPLVNSLKEGRKAACGMADFATLRLPLSTVQSLLQQTLEMLKKGVTSDSGL
jgi:hypothetical protein